MVLAGFMLHQMYHFMTTIFSVECKVVPEAVDSINGLLFAYFKFLGCDTGSQELNRDADFLFGGLVSESREFLKIIIC